MPTESPVIRQVRTSVEHRVKELNRELEALETVLEVLPKPQKTYRRKATNGRRRKNK